MLNLLRRHLGNQLQHQILPREAQLAAGGSLQSSNLGCSSHFNQRRQIASDSSAYQGDGKTTVSVLNDTESHLNVVNTYSSKGFRLSNNLFIYGSILLFPTNVFSWNVRRGKEITIESLLLFDIIVPKTKIVIIGYGQYGEDYDASIPVKLKKKGISCEMLATPNAVTTYNYLVHDSVHVAGAFVPVIDDVKMDQKDIDSIYMHRHLTEELPYITQKNQRERVLPFEQKALHDKTVNRDKDKTKFDED